MDYNNVNISKEISTIWNVANIIRGVYKHSDFRKVILPMTIIRRLECALAPYKTEFLNELEAFGQKDIDDFNRDTLASMTQGSGYFYNTSEFDLSAILKDETYVKENFINYIDGFSPIVRDILKGFDFAKQVDILDESDRLYSVIQAFANLDLDPKTVDTVRMGYIFEDLIRRFSENEDAGDHFTGKDLVALSTDIILANGCEEILTTRKQTRILDQACGTGGMLMTTYNRIKELNPYAEIELWGQEINPESKAICTAEMLIREQDPTHIALGDTMKEDKSKGMVMNIIHMNPPFGQKWSGKDAGTGVQQSVEQQHERGERFKIALPSDDMQLLFFQSAIEKMDPKGCRCAIYSSGTPLFKGDIGSGDSKIREYMVKNDLIDAIIQLPVNLFYNTGISTYIWILDNNKPETRKGKIQLIDATSFCHKSAKALGQKTNELTQEDRDNILRLYNEYQTNDFSKVLPNDEFLVRQFTTILPKRRTYKIDLDLLLQSGKLNTLYNPSKVDALNAQFDETGELTAKERTLLEKYNTNKPLYDGIVTIIKTNEHTFTSTNPKDMITYLQPILPSTLKPKEVENIVEGMSERDLSAPIQTDKKGNPIYDKETKDSEVLKGYDDLDEYMKREVLDYQPETHYESEPEKTGAEIAFNRYFYKYETPKPTEEIMKEIDAIDEEIAKLKAELKGIQLSCKYKELKKSEIYECVTKGLPESRASRGYKDSGIEWIGEIPEDWGIVKNAKIMHRIKDLIQEYNNETILSLSVIGMVGRYRYGLKGKTPRNYIGYQRIKKGDLVLCLFDTDITPCCTGIAQEDGITSPAYSRMYVDESIADRGYYYYWYTNIKNMNCLYKLAHNVRNSISASEFAKIKVPLPPIHEQQSIATYLDQKCTLYDSLSNLYQAKANKLKELKKSMIYEYVTGKKQV